MRKALLLAIAAILLPLPAFSQPDCPVGKVSADQAHCCWPGQTWSTVDRACLGDPECPPGYERSGAQCVFAQSATDGEAIFPPGAAPVIVRFRAREAGDQLTVQVAQASCTTPCSMLLPPGINEVSVTGPADFKGALSLGDSPEVEVEISRHDRRMVAAAVGCAMAGVVLTSAVLLVDLHPGSTSSIGSPAIAMVGCVGVGLALMGMSFALGQRGQDRLDVVAPKQAEGPKLIGLGLAPTADRGMAASAAFSFE